MHVPQKWERWGRNFRQKVLDIEDADLQLAVGIFLEALNDPDEDLGIAVFAPENTLRLSGIRLDVDIHAALEQRTSPETVRRAAAWIQGALAGACPAYAAWLLHRVEVAGMEEDLTRIVSPLGVVWDLQQRRLVRKTKRKRR